MCGCVQPSRVNKLLGDQPNLMYAGSNVNLTITIDCINIIVMETGDVRIAAFSGVRCGNGGVWVGRAGGRG